MDYEINFVVAIDKNAFRSSHIYLMKETDYKVGLTGDSPQCGSWSVTKFVPLSKIEKFVCVFHLSNPFSRWHVRLKMSGPVNFRFFLYREIEHDMEQKFSIIAWESRFSPRAFTPADLTQPLYNIECIFGDFGGQSYIQKGWLTQLSQLRVRLVQNASNFSKNIQALLQSHPEPAIFISCIRHDFDSVDPMHLLENDLNESTGPRSKEDVGSRTSALVSRLEIENPYVHPGETALDGGTPFSYNSDVTFYVKDFDSERSAVEILYHLAMEKDNETEYKFLGSSRFGPFAVTSGRKRSQVISRTGLAIGSLTIQYLVINPIADALQQHLNFAATYCKYWRFGPEVEVGHRGMGTYWFGPEKTSAM
ncbi:Glycerophosphocholine phosphodiesterase gpcpd1 [Cichlidogyrus casuarinus]|uniref:Glycerophosphocholine phosphodiesterase gpcpd1 n=1 Tax=Cichlidogyrus casuarinus TaxID=1844966 RepID=A0ABD2QG33_9PLAT